jgi:hypothetical protein
LVECAVLGAVYAVLERSCYLHVMPMLSKLECGVQGAVWRSCWACCPGAEGAADYCPAAAVPCRCCQACCPSAEGVAGRAGCCPTGAAECCCCSGLGESCCPCCQVLQSVVAVQALGRAVVHAVRCCRVLLLSKCCPTAAGAAGAVQQVGIRC